MGMPMARCGAVGHVVRFLRAHAALSLEQSLRVDAACGFPCKPAGWGNGTCGNFSEVCMNELRKAERAVGDFYVYNYYDTCGDGNQVGASYMPGGQTYPCGTGEAVAAFCNNEDVRAALHMKPISFYGRPWNAEAFGNEDAMQYAKFSGCSFSLYPELLQRYSAVIYNGDFDTCVPFTQNEEWTSMLAKEEGYRELLPWQPWPQHAEGRAAGYVRTHATGKGTNFTLLTVKGAGHMVPTYKPKQAYDFLQRFLSGQGYL